MGSLNKLEALQSLEPFHLELSMCLLSERYPVGHPSLFPKVHAPLLKPSLTLLEQLFHNLTRKAFRNLQ